MKTLFKNSFIYFLLISLNLTVIAQDKLSQKELLNLNDTTNQEEIESLTEEEILENKTEKKALFNIDFKSLFDFNKFQEVLASCYGPGLYGNKTANGILLKTQTLGIAHKNLQLNKPIKILANNNKVIDVKVIDRGPFIKSREIDITEATAKELGFKSCSDFGVRKIKVNYN